MILRLCILIVCSLVTLTSFALDRSPATYASGLTSANDPNIQEGLLELRKLAHIPSTATHGQVEDVILKAMVQAYGLSEMNLYDFDLLVEKYALQKIMKPKRRQAAVYAELLALRNIKEVLDESLKAIVVKEAEDAINDGGVPDYGKHILDKIAAMRKDADQREGQAFPYIIGSRKLLLDLALEEMTFFAEDLHEFFLTGNRKIFGTAEAKHAKQTTEEVKKLRRTGIFEKVTQDHDRFASLFAPKKGEMGIDVAAWTETASEAVSDELKESLNLDRSPGEEPELSIYPSAGPAGNIDGSKFPTGTWAITFDDGPAKTTPGVFANLKKHDLKSTFFMLSQQIEKSKAFQEFAHEEDENFETACHSFSHPQMPKQTPKNQHKEIEGAAQIFEKVVGHRPRYFRLPYGAGVSISSVRQKIAQSCMVHVFWNVDTLDWQDKNPESIKKRTIKQIEHLGRGVILFHDIHPQSVIASEMIMSYFQEQQKATPEKNIRLVTIGEITDEMNHGKEWSCEVKEDWKNQKSF